MNKKPSVIVIAALLLANACGTGVGAREAAVVESVPVVADLSDYSSIDESIADPLPDQTVSTPDRTSGSTQSAPSSTAPTTTTVTVVPTGQETTTTQPPVEIDLDALTEALRELDVLLGLFDGQVDSVDLDETEGETP